MGSETALADAESVVEAWENAEGESMREGHRVTMKRFIAQALSAAEKRGAESMRLRAAEIGELWECREHPTNHCGCGPGAADAIRALPLPQEER